MKEKGLSDFMKFAYAKGKVRKVDEAFEEYPVENEWHKGRIENYKSYQNSRQNKDWRI